MAVFDAYPGPTAEITVNKKPLAENDDNEEASPTEITKHIEACSSADFVVKKAEGVVDLRGLRKEAESKRCIEVSYRWITNFRLRKECDPDKPPTQPSENSQAPKPRGTLPTIIAIPEKVLKEDAGSHQAV